ncbi:hypothetical protein FOA52_008708 [Chlamydomonas sp. UWO 241]|nr:hypothetical protein FOA52_008708 [Chlamydomonas sp. UWO 241]
MDRGCNILVLRVLSKALEVWGLSVVPLDHPDMRGAKAEPQNEAAFICNLQEHWFTIRVMADGSWWNFNSLFPAPQPTGTFYLSVFLASLEEQGYQIFVVRGNLPPPQGPPEDGDVGGPGRWVSIEEAKAANKDAEGVRKKGKLTNALENALSAAAANGGQMTLRSKRGRSADAGAIAVGDGDDDADADLAAAIAASLGSTGAGASTSGSVPASQPAASGTLGVYDDMPALMPIQKDMASQMDEDEDADMAAAIAASLADGGEQQQQEQQQEAPVAPLAKEPAPGPGVVELALRLPDGQRATRRFEPATDRLSALYTFAAQACATQRGGIVLSTAFPKKDLSDSDTLLVDAGITDAQLLQVAPRR